MAEDCILNILSPAGAKTEVFKWTNSKKGEIRDENSEIVDIIHFIVEDVKELRQNRELTEALKNIDKGSFEYVQNLCNIYNRAISKLLDEWSRLNFKPSFLNQMASKSHVQFILLQCYNRAVAEPDKLNQYPPFSPQVYGETSFELISQMIETVKISPEDSFIDLGSGVGQVVLQVAACSDAKFCYGIEKAEYPATCAARLDAEFRRWMSFYGKGYRPYLLERGDFLSAECHERIASAGVLFANNFAFGPEVDHQLKQRFANLKEGARIISSKAFCPLNFRISDRNLSDIGSIMHVTCLNPIQDAVSWTDKPFSYFVHTIDRSLLERYFSRLKNPKLRDENENVRRDRKGRVISDQALKDGFHTNGTNKASREATENRNQVRNRRSQSLCSSAFNNQSRRSTHSTAATGAGLRRSRSKGHLSETGTRASTHSRRRHVSVAIQRRRQRQTRAESELTSYTLRAKLNGCATTVNKLKLNKSRLLHRTIVDGHLASLSLNSDSRLLLSSASDSNIESCCPTEGSGHTTPSGPSSLSSAGCTHGENHVGSARDFDADKAPGSAQYSPPSKVRAAHKSTDRGRPLGCHSVSASSSSSFVSSLSATRSPPSGAGDLLRTDSDAGERSRSKQPPIRITLSISATKPTKPDTTEDESAEATLDETITPGVAPKPDSGDSSVARRRAVRKCRQLPQPAHHPLAQQSSAKYRSHTAKLSGRGRPAQLCRSRRSPRGRPPIVRPRKGPPPPLSSSRNRTDQAGGGVEALHAETLAQVRVTKPNQPCGLNDPSMASFTCHYQPVQLESLQKAKVHALNTSGDPNIGHSQQTVPLALTQYLEMTKRAFMDHLSYLRSPAYADLVRQQVAIERARQAELLARKRTLEDNIKRLHADGCDLLRNFTKRLGILISTPSAFFAQARKLIKHHHMLEDKIAEFRNEISQLSSANQDLVRRHQVEAARLLSTALHTTKSSTNRCTKRDHKLSTSSAQMPTTSFEKTPLDATSTTIPVTDTPVSHPPCLTHMSAEGPVRPHSTKPQSGHHVHRSLPRLSPQSTIPSSTYTTPTNTTIQSARAGPPPAQAPILFRSPEEPLRFGHSDPIPPPPPLLPMHNPPQVPSTRTDSSNVSGSSSPRAVARSSVELCRSKSMHASLQDLIIDEFSRPKLDYTAQKVVSPRLDPSTSVSTQSHTHSLPPRKRAWSVTDPAGHSWAKYSRLQSSHSSTPIAGPFPLSPPALSPVSMVSPDDETTEVSESGRLAVTNAATVLDDQGSPPRILSTFTNPRGFPPPLLCATEYPPGSSGTSSIALPLVATPALRP